MFISNLLLHGLFRGHLRTLIFDFWKNACVTFEVWHGALSCWKIVVWRHSVTCSAFFHSSLSKGSLTLWTSCWSFHASCSALFHCCRVNLVGSQPRWALNRVSLLMIKVWRQLYSHEAQWRYSSDSSAFRRVHVCSWTCTTSSSAGSLAGFQSLFLATMFPSFSNWCKNESPKQAEYSLQIIRFFG